jgi:hypothetical protein
MSEDITMTFMEEFDYLITNVCFWRRQRNKYVCVIQISLTVYFEAAKSRDKTIV